MPTQPTPPEPSRPTIVCLCGSTRFCAPAYQDSAGLTPWQRANFQETLAGRIVLSIGVDTKSDAGLHVTAAQKVALDALHLRKVELADEVLVLNVGGYIGASTRRELDYAYTHGKRVRYLEPPRCQQCATVSDTVQLHLPLPPDTGWLLLLCEECWSDYQAQSRVDQDYDASMRDLYPVPEPGTEW